MVMTLKYGRASVMGTGTNSEPGMQLAHAARRATCMFGDLRPARSSVGPADWATHGISFIYVFGISSLTPSSRSPEVELF
jgi:hypothetical protein